MAAPEAGAKYMVLTAKHCDGFALFDDGDATTWDVMERTPYKKDLIDAYVKACRKYGLKVGVYYSHRLDGYHGGASPKYRKILSSHIETILTKYKPDLMWYDLGKEGEMIPAVVSPGFSAVWSPGLLPSQCLLPVK